ncbi:MAG: hypothetical protein EPO28_11465 [Saprospiraceae bacterium]|nr:MAG: hypothetical protein EPO28_11465 [Saprospiraceae bacterium]
MEWRVSKPARSRLTLRSYFFKVTYKIVTELIEKTSTDAGLKVNVRILDKHLEIGIKTEKAKIDFSRIQQHPKIPELSYRIAA